MKSRPLFTATLFFIAGIVLGRAFHFPVWSSEAILIFCVAALIVTYFKNNVVLRWAAGLMLALTVGVLRITPIAFPELPENHITHWIDKGKMTVEGTIERPPVIQVDGAGIFVLSVEKLILSENEYTTAVGKLQIRVTQDIPQLEVGERIRLTTSLRHVTSFRTPGAFDRQWFYASQGIRATGYARSGDRIERVDPAPLSFWQLVEKVRTSVRKAATKSSVETGAVVRALILGEQSAIDANVYQSFTNIGINHLLAISGLHVMAIAGLVFWAVWALGGYLGNLPLRFRMHRVAAFVALPFPIAYALLAGGTISVVRACIMYLAFIVAILLGRQREIYTALAMAAIIILLHDPGALWSKGFQLSFAAVLGMIYLRGPIENLANRLTLTEKLAGPSRMQRIRRFLVRLLGFSTAAFAATAPITAWHFGQIAPSGILANLAAIPIFSILVVPALLAGVLVMPISNLLTQGLWAFGAAMIDQVYGMALLLDHLGVRRLFIGRPTWLEIAAFVVVLLMLPYLRNKRWRAFLAGGLAVLVITPLAQWEANHSSKELKLTMLDVGQGLSMLIEAPGGKRMLFDGGGLAFSDFDIGRAVVVPFLSTKRIGTIDIMVVSHPHPDHFRGLITTLETVRVKELWAITPTVWSQNTGDYLQLLDRAKEKEIPIHFLNDRSPPQALGPVDVHILNPPARIPSNWNLNDQSLALRMDYGDRSILLCADMEAKAEKRLLTLNRPLQAELVQAGHHGSASSSLPEFVKRTHANYVFIPVGLYNFWHLPSQKVIDRWIKANAIVLRTDHNGAIECKSTVNSWTCKTL